MSKFAKLTLAVVMSGLLVLMLPERWREWAWAVLLWSYLGIVCFGFVFPHLRLFIDTIRVLPTSKRVVALTFDDGPDPRATPLLLDLLAEMNVKASFFCVGRNVAANPDLTNDIIRRGHSIGNHTHNHHWWWLLSSASSLRREISSAQQVIQQATGRRPELFRPPFGFTNPRLSPALRRAELRGVCWTIRSLDTLSGTPESVVARIVGRLRPGAIILLHDGTAQPARLATIVRQLIAELRRRQYDIVRLDQALS